MTRMLQLAVAAAFALALSGCAALAGGAVAGGAYEYQNKKQLETLEQQFEAGEISREEYLQRKEEIESGSVVY